MLLFNENNFKEVKPENTLGILISECFGIRSGILLDDSIVQLSVGHLKKLMTDFAEAEKLKP